MRTRDWAGKKTRWRRPPVGVLVVLIALLAVGGWWVGSTGDSPEPIAAPPPSSTRLAAVAPPTTVPPTFADPGGSNLRLGVGRAVGSPATIARANGARVPLFSAAGDTEPGDVVDNPTWEGLPVTFLVMEQRGDWLNGQISRRPNQSTAWVRKADVTLEQTPYKIRVDTANHRLVLTDRDRTVLDVEVAVGTGGTPTPTGTFFVDGTVQLTDPTGPYGTHQVSVAAFSEVLTSFGGGNGQIAIHGTNRPGLMGSNVSNGCVRMTNEDVTKLATMVPVGTPVEISG
ncbi:MAG: L,D-transpeptidase family protein [Acidimicrobiales bacterium]